MRERAAVAPRGREVGRRREPMGKQLAPRQAGARAALTVGTDRGKPDQSSPVTREMFRQQFASLLHAVGDA